MKIILLWLLPFFAVLQSVTGNAPLPWAEKPAEEVLETVPEEDSVPEVHVPERLGFETGNIGSGERARISADEDGNVCFGDGWGPGLWKRTPDGETVKLNDDNIRLLNELDGWLYYCALNEDTVSVVRLRTDGSEREILAEHADVDHLIAAESGLYYEVYELNEPAVIVRLPLDGGEEIPLWESGPERGWGIILTYWDRTLYVGTLDALYAVSVPDGKTEKVRDEGIVYAAADEEGLFLVRREDRQSCFIDAKTGEETAGRQLWVTFHYDGGFLYRYDYAPGNTRIVLIRVDLRTGEEETVLRLSDRLFTPDGKETEAPFSAATVGGSFPEGFDTEAYREPDGTLSLRMEWIDCVYTVGGRIVCEGRLREAAEKKGYESCYFAVGDDGEPEYWG